MNDEETNKTEVEIITFEELRKASSDIDEDSFDIYLHEIYKELSESKFKGINISRFYDFLPECPKFVSNKFFLSLLGKGEDDKCHLTYEEFSSPLKTLKFGTYEEVVQIIFNLCDFDKDGLINSTDVKHLVSFLPLRVENQNKLYHYQMESLIELDLLIKETFSKEAENTFEDFLKILDTQANIFLLLCCYLHLTIPVFDKSLRIYRRKKNSYKAKKEKDLSQPFYHSSSSGPDSPNIKIFSHKELYMSPSLFSSVNDLKEKNKKNLKVNILNSYSQKSGKLPSINIENEFEDDKLKSPKIIDSPGTPIRNSLKKLGAIQIQKNEDQIQYDEEIIKANNNIKVSPNHFLKRQRIFDEENNKRKSSEIKSVSNHFIDFCEIDEKAISDEDFMSKINMQSLKVENYEIEEKVKKEEDEVNEIKESITHEGDLFKFSKKEKGVLMPFYLAIIDQSIYYYHSKDDPKEDYYKTHYLAGCFIRDHQKEKINGEYYFSFSIIFPHSVKRYFHNKYDVIHSWVMKLREAIGYKNFFDYFTIGDTIGEGQYGIVKAGINLVTKEKVAIKILKKGSIKKPKDWDLIRTEIDIMKHSKHPSIIQFVDHYENSDYIFIVMELLKLGSLQRYLDKKNFKISEKTTAIIAYQIADALLYLHKYGVIHRDLKPDNILIHHFEENDEIIIKLMDFGLSKIIGKEEKTAEGYGTMAFIAPEIVKRKLYDNSVDIWSLGVIIYYCLSGEIPFMPTTLEISDMATNICQNELRFSKRFENKSSESKDLITKCLIKVPEKRIKIEEIINHEWFKKQLN